MSILTEKLPQSVSIDGVEYPINTDFRVWLRFDELTQDAESIIRNFEKIIFLCVKKCALPEPEKLIRALINFYRAEFDTENEKKHSKSNAKEVQVFSYKYDAEYIYASFMSEYHIDLIDIPYMHWWKFHTLLKTLSEDSRLMKVIGYRSLNTHDIKDRKMKKSYEKMKRLYALPDMRSAGEKESEFAEALSKL